MNVRPRFHGAMTLSSLKEEESWASLEARAAEPAHHAVRAWLVTALHHLPQKRRPLLITARASSGELLAVCGAAPGLIARPPLLLRTRWSSFSCLETPLIDGRRPKQAVQRLLDAFRAHGAVAAAFVAVPRQGPFMQALEACAADLSLRLDVQSTWKRATLDATVAEDDWWRAQIRRRRRKEWQRLERRLRERGKTRYETLGPGDDPRPWIEDFMRLEAAGWKGRAGTALIQEPGMAEFVTASLLRSHADGALRFWRLVHEGRTIASLFATVHARRLLLGKIAYDESFAAFSPGVLVTLHATRDILADPAVDMADSCAIPDHPMIDHIWKDRLEMADVLITLPGAPRLLAALVAAAERTRYHTRSRLKRAWHALRRGGRRS